MLTARIVEARAKARDLICSQCEKRVEHIGIATCSACGCLLALKRRLTEAKCPLGKWEKVDNLAFRGLTPVQEGDTNEDNNTQGSA